ncbi:sensor histidine kinase [Marinirhabdus gelatinilytica]|uniref:histidine kinase n=1 Tax=Marinirhabdus gelatinilytica TaxID=1703343 RepID=A0A370QET4_9FLAO|nr:HAMP domain-containing sensor histidine kinase [Marinirhabdus gelatinilytica]RDK86871.1 two-component system phosphate regulon sensor histidine kinase PhoR [Marinirhabdus gelatinilytica]
MNKKLFLLLVGLMSLSLVGIIFVQGYWIKNAYRTKYDQFSYNVKNSLLNVASQIQARELDTYYSIYSDIVDSIGNPNSITYNELLYATSDGNNFEKSVFYNSILEEDFKLSANILDTEIDSIQFKRLTNRKERFLINNALDGSDGLNARIESISRLTEFERNQFDAAFRNISGKKPIHQRVSKTEIDTLLRKQLVDRGIESPFEYAVFSRDLATKVQSENFEADPEYTYSTPLFVNEDLNTQYQLYVSFADMEKEVLSGILGIAILSLIFTGVIVLAYSSALSQLFKQRQISQIKSDFINNMTHEFKTPIATINLALDALKNPKVKDNKEFLTRYLKMIRDENRRMHAQVENVLRISKLEKNELDLPKERLKMHDIIENAVSHVELIVEDRGGYIKTHFGALKSSVLANDSHLTNVVVNILDNGIKYSEGEPRIDVYTENVKNTIIVKIRDQGVGMSKSVQKKIFEKFYREHTGDIHNVKGHGLGLAYVKRILDDHDAQIYVESEKGKGSTFIIKLHLIS